MHFDWQCRRPPIKTTAAASLHPIGKEHNALIQFQIDARQRQPRRSWLRQLGGLQIILFADCINIDTASCRVGCMNYFKTVCRLKCATAEVRRHHQQKTGACDQINICLCCPAARRNTVVQVLLHHRRSLLRLRCRLCPREPPCRAATNLSQNDRVYATWEQRTK